MTNRLDKEKTRLHHQRLVPLYQRFGLNLQQALITFLEQQTIFFLDISFRIKDFDSFWEKVERKGYKDPFAEVEDICGIRVICYFASDIERISKIIKDELTILQEIDKAAQLARDRFGYLSTHFIVTLKESWLDAPNYRGLRELKAEIQVRTVLMHAWAEIQHKLIYKNKSHVPDQIYKRFARIISSFETADEEFDRLRSDIAQFQEQTSVQINYDFRRWSLANVDWNLLVSYLEKRYKTNAFEINNKKLPVSVLWSTTDSIHPDQLLTKPLENNAHQLSINEDERTFLKLQFQNIIRPMRGESSVFRMLRILLDPKIHPQIACATGRYFDNVLTQDVLEWETNKALADASGIDAIKLHRRDLIDNHVNPLTDGSSRCAALAFSVLFVFKRSGSYYTLVRRRLKGIPIAPEQYHVLPSAMFEAACGDTDVEYSIEHNVLRELLEEVYDVDEVCEPNQTLADFIFGIDPVPTLMKLLGNNQAELSATGLCVNLLTLRPEITAVLVVHDEYFVRQKRMALNWEWHDLEPGENFAIPVGELATFIKNEIHPGSVVPSGAVALKLGFDWMVKKGLMP